jgi:hypothetical protein
MRRAAARRPAALKTGKPKCFQKLGWFPGWVNEFVNQIIKVLRYQRCVQRSHRPRNMQIAMATEFPHMSVAAPGIRHPSPSGSKVLFVTSEITDYAQTGGLGEVSAALPRALRAMADVRILIPGYRQVLERIGPVDLVATLPGFSDIPPCALGRGATHDGIPVYVVLCGQLYDRPGGLYLDPDSPRLAGQRSALRPPEPGGGRDRRRSRAIRTGSPTTCTSTTGRARSPPAISPGAASGRRAC